MTKNNVSIGIGTNITPGGGAPSYNANINGHEVFNSANISQFNPAINVERGLNQMRSSYGLYTDNLNSWDLAVDQGIRSSVSMGGAQGGGGELNAGHINYFLGATSGILAGNQGARGMSNFLTSLQAEWNTLGNGLSLSKEINLTENICTGLKWFGRASGTFSVLSSGTQYWSGQISGSKFGLDASITGASFIPVIGWYIGAQYFVIDNTIGVRNFSNIMINQEIQRVNMINNGNWGIGFYPHIGMGVR